MVMYTQQRPRSACTYVQADLGLCWAKYFFRWTARAITKIDRQTDLLYPMLDIYDQSFFEFQYLSLYQLTVGTQSSSTVTFRKNQVTSSSSNMQMQYAINN